ncbi:MAG: hypothetical protein HQL22_04205 [Candidatus Omnitrophica bacterium]|nr:hypothetical protein [Candidatus Omnitrophota bacterium]
MPVNLISTEFKSCSVFPGLAKYESIYYKGVVSLHFQKFLGMASGLENILILSTVIRRDEVLMWEGTKDLLGRAIKDAAARARGIYTFELLAFNALNELNTFNYKELAQVLVNSSLRLHPGCEMLIRYSSMYGILRKMVDEPWGKINFTTAVEILSEETGSIYALIGRALRMIEGTNLPVAVIINDLSAVPLYNPHSDEQLAILNKLIAKHQKKTVIAPRECWVEGIRIMGLQPIDIN